MAKPDDEEMKTTRVAPRKTNTSGVAAVGDVVKVRYRGTLDDGEEFDSSEGRDPLEFVVGEHDVIKGFEDAVVGMRVGEKRRATILPENAYGDPNPGMRQDVPREALGDIEPEEGMVLALHHPEMTQPLPARVVAVSDESVTLDLNHPLAGKTLTFEIELVELR